MDSADLEGVPMNDEMPLTHIERMDQLVFQRETKERELRIQAEQAVRVAKEKRKAERSTMWLGIAIATVVGAVLFSLVYAWWIIPDPPKTPEDYRNTEAGREQTCFNNGGGWVPKELLRDGSGSSDHGMCVFPGKRGEVSK